MKEKTETCPVDLPELILVSPAKKHCPSTGPTSRAVFSSFIHLFDQPDGQVPATKLQAAQQRHPPEACTGTCPAGRSPKTFPAPGWEVV